MADGIDVTGTNLFAPQYVSPRSVQMNIGVQHEFRHGMVFTADYLRNVSTHNLMSIDTNHIGDSRFFNLAERASRDRHHQRSVRLLPMSIAPSANGATITDYASNGLDSGYSVCGGLACPVWISRGCRTHARRFPGINQNVGTNQMLFPDWPLCVQRPADSLRQNVSNPLPGIRYLNLQVSYAFSRYVSTARDNDFINFPTDNADPTNYIGPNGLDRTHQLSFGGTMDLAGPLPHEPDLTLRQPAAVECDACRSAELPGGLFQTDITGDGTGDGTVGSNGGAGDLLPGTNVGDFGRRLESTD